MLIKLLVLSFLVISINSRWTEEKAAQWYKKYEWSTGFNYAPSYAVNELEMWLSFNQTIIERELKWAQEIGFSKLRVFLHLGAYILTPDIFLLKMEKFIQIAKSYNHQVIPVLFDDCWKPHWTIGTQPDPIPGLHNSQWVQCAGQETYEEITLRTYVFQIIKHFKNDPTVVMWDLYNEVGNSGKTGRTLPLLKKTFDWARQANPSQPLTSGHWNSELAFEEINSYIFSESDVITFHAYCDVLCTKQAIKRMQQYNRPVICTQYMARPLGSKFISHLPVFKQDNVWAINWGFVYGRTQTYYPWWSKEGDPVPEIWFHDVIHANGTPFDTKQTDFIRNITKISQ